MLLQEQKYLEDIVNKAKTGLSATPDGHLRISKDKIKVDYILLCEQYEKRSTENFEMKN